MFRNQNFWILNLTLWSSREMGFFFFFFLGKENGKVGFHVEIDVTMGLY
jgi:hypothetical protein